MWRADMVAVTHASTAAATMLTKQQKDPVRALNRRIGRKQLLATWCDRYSDSEIASANRPRGYQTEWRLWPGGAWCQHRYHLFHIHQCAQAMARCGDWVGPPATVYFRNGKFDGVSDANHRRRAVKFLFKQSVRIKVSMTKVELPV